MTSRNAGHEDYTDVFATLVQDTDDAYLINDSRVQEWVPKSQVEVECDGDPEIGKDYNFNMPEWLAIDKGFE